MRFRLKKLTTIALMSSLVLSLPGLAWAGSDTGWVKSPKLYEVHTLVGQSEVGHQDGALDKTTFYHPHSAIALSDGRLLVSDTKNHSLRMVTTTSSSKFTGFDLYLGQDKFNEPIGAYNDADLATAAFNKPAGLALDAQENIYVADSENHAIRRISKDGKVTTLAGNGLIGSEDGQGAVATFYNPSDVAVDSKGNVYVADTLNHVIRKITANGNVSTLTAPSTRVFEYFPGAVEDTGDFMDGPIASAKFNEPSGLALDAKGNLYVSDRGNQRIRYIDFKAGTVSTVVGGGELEEQQAYVAGDYVDGDAKSARLNAPEGIAVTADGALVIADSLNHAIRIVKDGKVSTLAGGSDVGHADGVSSAALFNHPTDVTILADGRLVIVDEYGNKIRVLKRYSKPNTAPQNHSIDVVVNGAIVKSDVAPQLKAGAVSLPVRAVATALGYKVSFDKKTGGASLTKGDIVYTIANNSKTVIKTVNGKTETLTLNAATSTVNNRLYIPVRFFAAESGLDVQWDVENSTVVIRNKVF
ncbi:MAG: stalk domain-containing protein [Candidatus Cohnella colombiensis]|uniref:Stalk domain-containing protein n=1 Tax=Candidatus Cohnella colombiensis TaxID=3121368 RepID=A0AA95JCP4_9BACL|nr:MAG: stalk domain-containing protein [Cohnella sp.]